MRLLKSHKNDRADQYNIKGALQCNTYYHHDAKVFWGVARLYSTGPGQES